MLPSDWLAGIEPRKLYTEQVLHLLREQCDIGYQGGQLTSYIRVGHPYSTHSRLASIRLMTQRQAVLSNARLNQQATTATNLVMGVDIANALWELLHPILEDGPPSKWLETPEEKFAATVAAIRRYGY